MRHRHKNSKCNKLHSNHWSTAGVCLALMSSTASTSPAEVATNTSLDDKTQQAIINAINDEYYAPAFYNAVMDKFGEIRPLLNYVICFPK